jgi:hypothetical protein
MDDNSGGITVRTLQPDTADHRFGVGLMVHFRQDVRYRNIAGGDYMVLAQLPVRDGELQYLVRGNREPYDRVIKENEVEAAQDSGV